MLHIKDLTYRIGERVLFDAASVSIPKGHKVGLVGRNGAGKSTLFRLILGEIAPDSGVIDIFGRQTLGTVLQDAPDGPESLLETVLASDVERTTLLANAETETDPNRIAEIHTRLADIDAHTAPARASSILNGLGFDEKAQLRPCSSYSGGWRMRVALASTLFLEPDILLLDEPTNHLDLETVMWLENYLSRWSGTLVIISHERTLLNRAVKEIIHLNDRRLTLYTGGYDTFERTRRERLEQQDKLRSRQQKERKRIQSFVDRFRYKATKARQAQSRLKMLERMEPIASVVEEHTVSFEFPKPDPLSPPLIALDNIAVGYEPGKPVLDNLDLRIDMDDRIALLGANGNGKSTMIKLLSNRLVPTRGKLIKSKKLQIGYFAQHQTDELNTNASAYEHLNERYPMEPEARLRAHLGRFGFPQARADTKVESLSGGEKTRLLFALMSTEKPHILLLDEPTNHLDVDSRESLVEALSDYEGAVVLVSHDPHLIGLVADRLWIVENGTCNSFDGDLDDYEKRLLESRKAKRTSEPSKSEGLADNKKELRRQRAAVRKELAPVRKRAKAAEAAVQKFSENIEKIEAKLADPKLYENDSTDLAGLQKELGALRRQLETAEEEWLAAEEELEKLSAAS